MEVKWKIYKSIFYKLNKVLAGICHISRSSYNINILIVNRKILDTLVSITVRKNHVRNCVETKCSLLKEWLEDEL